MLRAGSGAALAFAVSPLDLGQRAAAAGAVDSGLLRRESDPGGWFLTKSIPLGDETVLGGLSWQDSETLRAEVRINRGAGWREWLTIDPLSDHLPDGSVAPSATSPVWFGDARAVQFRLSRAPSELRVRLLSDSTSGGISPGSPSPEGEIPGAPAFISRRRWRAQRPRTRPSLGRVRVAFIHHTVTANSYAAEDSARIVRSIQDYHRNVLGWDDIGYNALIDRYGRIFEGRGGGLERAVIGAQAQGFNAQSTGVALIGNHGSASASPKAVKALTRYLAWKLSVHGLDPNGKAKVVSAGGESSRTPKGSRVVLPRICGHRTSNLTACPGDALSQELPEIRRRVGRRMSR